MKNYVVTLVLHMRLGDYTQCPIRICEYQKNSILHAPWQGLPLARVAAHKQFRPTQSENLGHGDQPTGLHPKGGVH